MIDFDYIFVYLCFKINPSIEFCISIPASLIECKLSKSAQNLKYTKYNEYNKAKVLKKANILPYTP